MNAQVSVACQDDLELPIGVGLHKVDGVIVDGWWCLREERLLRVGTRAPDDAGIWKDIEVDGRTRSMSDAIGRPVPPAHIVGDLRLAGESLGHGAVTSLPSRCAYERHIPVVRRFAWGYSGGG